MAELEKSLDAFFKSNNRVLVIKGPWGIGKTYYWNNYFESKKEHFEQSIYSYVSLFGKNSLKDVRKNILYCANSIKPEGEVTGSSKKECSWVERHLPKLKTATRLADLIKIPHLDKSAELISAIEYSLIDNYLVCFDDLERKGNGLAIKEFMGLIDELAQKKDCKIILIFSEDDLSGSNEQDEFNKYREKIVDVEIKYSPSVQQNVECIFNKDGADYEVVIDTANKLDIKNIRLLKKIKTTIDAFGTVMKNADSLVRKEFVLHCMLLSWGYYSALKDLPYEELRRMMNDVSWFDLIGKKEKSVSEEKYSDILNRLGRYLHSSPFNDHIDFFLRHGFLNSEKGIEGVIQEKNSDANNRRLEDKISNVWSIYHSSFDDNTDEFIRGLIDILDTELNNIELRRFDQIISILDRLECNTDKYIDDYITAFSEKHDMADSRSRYQLRDASNKKIREKIQSCIEKSKQLSIEEIATKLANQNGWDSEDIDYLSTLSTQDYIDWMRSGTEDVVEKARSGLLKFKDMSSNDGRYELISDKVIAALKVIAKDNKLNCLRVKNMFNIDIDCSDEVN